MSDFIQFIAKKRQRLQAQRDRIDQQLQELNVAEKLFLRSQGTGAGGEHKTVPGTEDGPMAVGRTIKERVIDVLKLAPNGLTALDILQLIQRDIPSLTRTSLSPQLSRLKADQTLENDEESGLWRLSDSEEHTSDSEPRRAIDIGGDDDPFA